MERILFNADSPAENPTVQTLDKVIQVSLIVFVAFSMFSISITQISFTIGALSWLYKVYLTQTWKELKGTWVGIAILCFCLAVVLALITSVDLASSIKHLKKIFQFVIFFWAANSIQSEKHKDFLIRLLIFSAAIVSISSLHPYLTGQFSYAVRLKGTLSKEATFAGVLMLSGLVTLGRCLYHKPREKWVFVSIGMIAVALLLSLTRQAWLAFLVGSVFLIFICDKKYLLILPFLIAGLLLFSPDSISKRLFSLIDFKDGALLQRVATWKGGWEIFKDNPITGCGFKCVDTIHSQYPDPTGYIAWYKGMHSNIIQLLVDTGIIGLLGWIAIWTAFFIEIFKRCQAIDRIKTQGSSKGLLLGSAAAILGFLIGGCFESSLYDSEVTMLLYFIMGLALSTTANDLKTS